MIQQGIIVLTIDLQASLSHEIHGVIYSSGNWVNVSPMKDSPRRVLSDVVIYLSSSACWNDGKVNKYTNFS